MNPIWSSTPASTPVAGPSSACFRGDNATRTAQAASSVLSGSLPMPLVISEKIVSDLDGIHQIYRQCYEIYRDFTSSQEERDAKFLQLIQEHPNLFDPSIFDELPYEKQCQLAVMVTKNVKEDKGFSLLKAAQDILTLPVELKRLGIVDPPHTIISPQRGDNLAPYKVPSLGVIALATIINYRKLNPLNILVGIQFLHQYQKNKLLLDLAPYIIHLNLNRDANPGDKLREFLFYCSNVVYVDVSFTGITGIPFLARCEKLICNNCLSLVSIANLPLCESIDCKVCISLASIGNIIPARDFNVEYFKLDQKPIQYLMELGERFLLSNQPLPVICYIDLLDRKSFFASLLIQHLFTAENGLPRTANPLLPMMDEEQKLQKAYEIIGIIFSHCYEGKNADFSKIGTIFNDTFFILLKLLWEKEVLDDVLMESYLTIKIPSDEIFQAICGKLDNPSQDVSSLNGFTHNWNLLFQNKPEGISEKNHLVAEAKKDQSIKAIHAIAYKMYTTLSREFRLKFEQDRPETIQQIMENGRSRF